MRNPLISAKFRLRGLLWAKKKKNNFNNLHGRQNVKQKYINMLHQIEASCGPISGKNILEVGCDLQGEFLKYLTSQRQLDNAVGVNICLSKNEKYDDYSLLRADARSLPFPNYSFDLITSISAFEHIEDFEIALAEMYRVLRPGGYLFAEFAPIWSSVWGHHLWFYHGENVKDWRNTPLPPYAHLLMPEDELYSWVSDRYSDESMSRKILNFVYRSKDQNRLFFSDYEHIVANSAFQTLFLVGFHDLPLPKNYEVENLEAVLRKLHESFPDKTGFGYHGISMLLTKSSSI